MNVTKEHCVDASDEGAGDWYYAYTLFTFENEDEQLVARQYDDETSTADFIQRNVRRKRPRGWRSAPRLDSVPYDDPLFGAAVRHLVDVEGITEVRMCVKCGYVPVDLSRVV